MNLKNILLILVLGMFTGCHAPLLLTALSPKTKPKEKFKYYQPNFKLPENSSLRLDGYYLSIESERKQKLTLKRYQEMKKYGLSPVGFDIKDLHISSDTVLIIKTLDAFQFYADGTYEVRYFANRSKEQVHEEMLTKYRNTIEGGAVYKLKGDKILYETYSQMSGFTYNDGVLGEHTITLGKSHPYQFIKF